MIRRGRRLRGSVTGVENLGTPVSYLVLPDGVPVYDSGGAEIGAVEHVLADEGADIFHGLILRRPGLPPRYLYAARDRVGGLFERGVTLAVGADALQEPADDPVAAAQGDPMLRRAWDWLSVHSARTPESRD